MKGLKLGAAIVFILAIAGAFFWWDLGQYLSLEFLKSNRATFESYYESNPGTVAAGFVAIYILSTALSLPGATVITLAGGAIFGFALGTLLVSLSSTIGATLAFLGSRFFLRDFLQARFGESIDRINRGVEAEGGYYLFTLRLVPLFPFFMVNLLMGITTLRVGKYFWISWAGMLPGTLAYVNAGTQLSKVDSLGSILSLPVLFSFAILGLLPLFSKWLVERARKIRR